MYRLILSDPAVAADFAQKPCCDAAHFGNTTARYSCSFSSKGMYLYPDGTFAIIHRAGTVAPGHIVEPACVESLALLTRVNEKKHAEKSKEQNAATTMDSRKKKAVPAHLKKQRGYNANQLVGPSTGPYITAEEKKVAEEKQLAEEKKLAKEKQVAEEQKVAKEKKVAEQRRAVEENKIAEDKKRAAISKATSSAGAYVKRSSNSVAIAKLESQVPVSITVASYASDAAVHHGIFPRSSAAAEKPYRVPGSFPFETQVAKGNKLGTALQEAADSCATAKALDDAKKQGVTDDNGKGIDDDDWEMLEGAAVDEDDYVVVREWY